MNPIAPALTLALTSSGKYLVTGGREVTTTLTVHADGKWELADGAADFLEASEEATRAKGASPLASVYSLEYRHLDYPQPLKLLNLWLLKLLLVQLNHGMEILFNIQEVKHK